MVRELGRIRGRHGAGVRRVLRRGRKECTTVENRNDKWDGSTAPHHGQSRGDVSYSRSRVRFATCHRGDRGDNGHHDQRWVGSVDLSRLSITMMATSMEVISQVGTLVDPTMLKQDLSVSRVKELSEPRSGQIMDWTALLDPRSIPKLAQSSHSRCFAGNPSIV